MFASFVPLPDCEQLAIAEGAAEVGLNISKLILRSTLRPMKDTEYAVMTLSTNGRVHLVPMTYVCKPVFAVVHCTSTDNKLMVVARSYNHYYSIQVKPDFRQEG